MADITEVMKELEVTDELLDARIKLLEELPECQVHGKQCLPWYREWFKACQYIIQTDHKWKECSCIPCVDARSVLLADNG